MSAFNTLYGDVPPLQAADHVAEEGEAAHSAWRRRAGSSRWNREPCWLHSPVRSTTTDHEELKMGIVRKFFTAAMAGMALLAANLVLTQPAFADGAAFT